MRRSISGVLMFLIIVTVGVAAITAFTEFFRLPLTWNIVLGMLLGPLALNLTGHILDR